MPKISKENIRSLYKIATDYSVAQADVVARRPLHKKVALACDRWSVSIHVAAFLFALFFVALPAISHRWANFLFLSNVARWLAIEFSRPGIFFISCFAIMMMTNFYVGSKRVGSTTSNRGYPMDLRNQFNFRHVLDGELYPITREEERVFFVEALADFFGPLIWWPTVFGFLVFICK